MSTREGKETLEERIARQSREDNALRPRASESFRARQKRPQEDYEQPSELEQLALPEDTPLAIPFVYDDKGVHSHGELTTRADQRDYDRKVVRLRLQQRPRVTVQATHDGYELTADEPELRELFTDDLGATIPQMSLLVLHCRAQEQQRHMYREIAVKYDQENEELRRENDELRRVIEQDRLTFQATLDEANEEHGQLVSRLREEITGLKRAATTPVVARVPGRSPAPRAAVLPFTPARRTAPVDTTYGADDTQIPSTRFAPATPLVAPRHARRENARPTVKFPDPPMFKDGKEVKFEQWRDQLEDKLRANADHYAAVTQEATEQNMVAYMRTRTEGKAYESLSALIQSLRKAGEPFDYSYLLGRLEKSFGNPHKRVEARTAFRRLRLHDPSEFADYQGDFFQLAQEQGLPADQWVEEFHEKLTPTLRAAMAPHLRTADYDTYVDLARDIAREHAAMHRVERKRSGKFNAPTPTGRRAPTPTGHRSVTPNPSAPASAPRPSKPATDEKVTCYNCQKSGHYSRDCPAPRAEHKLIEEGSDPSESDDDDSEDSENGSA